MEPTPGWHHAGIEQEVTADRMARADQLFELELAQARQRREHYWIALVGFRVQPPMEGDTHLDSENIRTGPHVGCFLCEEPYAERIAFRRCKGEPR